MQCFGKCHKRPSEYYSMHCKVTWKSFCPKFSSSKSKIWKYGEEWVSCIGVFRTCETSKTDLLEKIAVENR